MKRLVPGARLLQENLRRGRGIAAGRRIPERTDRANSVGDAEAALQSASKAMTAVVAMAAASAFEGCHGAPDTTAISEVVTRRAHAFHLSQLRTYRPKHRRQTQTS